jgi:hypothetical protein
MDASLRLPAARLRLARAGRVLAGTAWALPLVVLGLLAANLVLHWPGGMNNDSLSHLEQARSGQWEDWDPPVMTWVWSLLLHVADGPGPYLVLHLAAYWAGFGLLGDGLRRAGRPGLAWLMALSGAFPPFLALNGIITKDASMVAAWLASLGLLAWFRLQHRRVPAWAWVIAVLLLAYGTLVRPNAAFAWGPILLWAWRPVDRGTWRLAAASVGVALVTVPVGGALNDAFFRAQKTHAEHSLFLFDLHGIAVHTGQAQLLQPRATLSLDEARACYTPYWWDSLSPWGRCAAKMHRPADSPLVTLPEGIARQWAVTLATHPAAWIEHRLKHFNSSLMWLIPLKHIRLTPEYATDDPAWTPLAQVSAAEVRGDLLRKNFIVWPVTWLTWGIGLMFLLHRGGATPATASSTLARVLVVSALGYSGAYLLVGVATDLRYHYWSVLALMIATLLALPVCTQAWRERRRVLWTAWAAVAFVVVTGTAARLADWRGLMQ